MAAERLIVDELTVLQQLRDSAIAVMSSGNDRPAQTAALHEIVQDFRQNSQRTHLLLAEYGASVGVDRVKQAQLNRFSVNLQTLIAELDQAMRVELQNQESDLRERRSYRMDEDFARSPDDHLTDHLLHQLAEADLAEEILAEREEGIRQIQQDVASLRSLFGQVAFHVNQQGVLLDNIEANVDSAAENTGDANTQLRQTYETGYSQRRLNKCLLFFGLFLCVVGGVLVVAR